MAYLLYTLTFTTLLLGTALYLLRARWLPLLPPLDPPDVWFPGRDYLYARLPGSFAADMEAGLSSATFDLGDNVEAGDSRAGLDAAAKRDILRIMKRRRLQFDEARRVYMEQRFQRNGIGADGLPRDPKLVTFS